MKTFRIYQENNKYKDVQGASFQIEENSVIIYSGLIPRYEEAICIVPSSKLIIILNENNNL